MEQSCCYVRYAIAPGIAERRAAATALKNWLNSQREVASQMFEKPKAGLPSQTEDEMRSERPAQRGAMEENELKTMAERAVDRVTQGVRLSKTVPAGF
jgi:hypothetical protein